LQHDCIWTSRDANGIKFWQKVEFNGDWSKKDQRNGFRFPLLFCFREYNNFPVLGQHGTLGKQAKRSMWVTTSIQMQEISFLGCFLDYNTSPLSYTTRHRWKKVKRRCVENEYGLHIEIANRIRQQSFVFILSLL